MAQPRRTPERAAQVLDRAARMGKFRPALWDRRLFDRQIATPGHTDSAPFRSEWLAQKNIKPLGEQTVPLDKVRTAQPSVSLSAVKAKLAGASQHSSKMPMLAEHKGTYYVVDGNHRITAARALNETAIKARVGQFMPNGRAPSPVSPAVVYKGMSPLLQVAGIGAAASTAYNEIRRANGTRREALKGAGLAAAPGALTMAAAGALAKAAPAVASSLAKYNPYVLGGAVAYNMARGAWEGYNAPGDRSWSDWAKGQPVPKQGWKGAAVGAAFGAADTLSFGLASYAAGRERPAFESGHIFGSAAPHLDASQQAAFAKANEAYKGRQLMTASASGTGKKPEYKDQWTDSLGRNYTRKNMAVRTRQDAF